MTSGLKMHRIEHLSPSALNTFAAAPAVYVMERLLKKWSPVGAAAHRGTAAEAGINVGLSDMEAPIEACQTAALTEFDRLCALSADPKRMKEREAIPGIVATGLAELRQYGQPTGYQGKVVHTFEGVPVPILGYWDWQYDNHGITIDLKTQLRLSSSISNGHARQVSLYIHGTNHQGRLAYTTPTKIGVYVLDRPQDHLADLVNIARRLDRFLAISSDPAEIAGLMVPDFESFYLSNPVAAANARELYGFSNTVTETADAG